MARWQWKHNKIKLIPALQAMHAEFVEAPTVVDHVPTLQYEHWAPAVAAKVPIGTIAWVLTIIP